MKFFRFLFLWGCLATTALVARLPNSTGVAFDAEFLYLLPTVDDTYFVIVSPTPALPENAERINSDFSFSPGFRVGLTYGLCQCTREAQLYYTRLRSTESKTVSGTGLYGTRGTATIDSGIADYTGTASAALDLLYQRVDGLLNQQLWGNQGFDFSVCAGLEYAYLRLNEYFEYAPTGGLTDIVRTVKQVSKTQAIGPQVGFTLAYDLFHQAYFLPGALSFVTHSSGSILAARTHELLALPNTGGFDVGDERSWRVVPAFHARLGLNYEMCFSCVNTSLEVGYEFNTYLRGLSRIMVPDDVGIAYSFNNYYNFDNQGLYIAATARF